MKHLTSPSVTLLRYTFLVPALLVLTSCGGGGGGGDDFIGAARAEISASPREVDSGDRVQVRIRIQEVHENGIALKVRFPAGLEYVADSSTLEVDDAERTIAPTELETVEEQVYLVYYLSQADMGDDEQGELIFQLEGRTEVDDGEIEVDPDVDDPDVSNSTEFNVETPEFGAEDSVFITVVD